MLDNLRIKERNNIIEKYITIAFLILRYIFFYSSKATNYTYSSLVFKAYKILT